MKTNPILESTPWHLPIPPSGNLKKKILLRKNIATWRRLTAVVVKQKKKTKQKIYQNKNKRKNVQQQQRAYTAKIYTNFVAVVASQR